MSINHNVAFLIGLKAQMAQQPPAWHVGDELHMKPGMQDEYVGFPLHVRIVSISNHIEPSARDITVEALGQPRRSRQVMGALTFFDAYTREQPQP